MALMHRDAWRARAAAHEARVDAWIQPHLARRDRGVKHPVEDFLFDYYSFRPAELRRWHPGYGVVLEDGADEYATHRAYSTTGGRAGRNATVRRDHLAEQAALIGRIRALLAATAEREASYGCLGMHEWAMAYRLTQEQQRHAAWPLRLGAAGTDAVVESHRIACSHFDAFRFFTPPARPLNVLQPGRDDRTDLEQPGCLHANMDLYKAAFRLSPLVPSELVADCFELARDIRALDMRASPYDLTDLGYEPVCIETPEGKQQYVEQQRRFYERAQPLRRRLVSACDRLLP